jgi:hypothetical protein
MKKLMFLAVVIFFAITSFGLYSPKLSPTTNLKDVTCQSCKNDSKLQQIINKIKAENKRKGAVLLSEEKSVKSELDENGRSIQWQGGFSYCNGQCFAVVTVTANCFLGYCWGYQATSQGDEDCICGTLCPCTVE